MFTDFQREYGKLYDDELLVLASDSASLFEEAKAALDCEMRNRGLTQNDLAKHQHLLKRNEQRASKKKARRLRKKADSWVDGVVVMFWTALGIALIWIAYLALPPRYRFSPDWQEAAGYTMFASVFLVASCASLGPCLRKPAFWISLLISSVTQACMIHWWIVRKGSLDDYHGRHQQEWAILLGPMLFLVVYGGVAFLRRKLRGGSTAIEADDR